MSTTYNPFEPRSTNTDFEELANLRCAGRVHEIMPGFFLVTRYEDVRLVMRDSATFGQGGFNAEGTADVEPDDLTLGQTDPPFHTGVRRNMARTMTPRALLAYEPIVRTFADTLAQRIARTPVADLTADLAEPLVVRVTSTLAGIAPEQADEIKQYASDFMLVGAAPQDPGVAAATARMRALDTKLLGVIAAARTEPAAISSPVLAALIASTDSEGRAVSDRRVLTHLTADTIVAGLETTIHLIGNMFFQILTTEGLYERLRAFPDQRQAVVEESLRHHPPVNFLLRTARTEASIGGLRIPKGSTIVVSLTSANRDPADFEDPTAFDPTRSGPNQHLAFGVGMHFCIGAPLARLEAIAVLDAMCAHVPILSLDPAEKYERVAFPIVRGPRHVRVRIGS